MLRTRLALAALAATTLVGGPILVTAARAADEVVVRAGETLTSISGNPYVRITSSLNAESTSCALTGLTMPSSDSSNAATIPNLTNGASTLTHLITALKTVPRPRRSRPRGL